MKAEKQFQKLLGRRKRSLSPEPPDPEPITQQRPVRQRPLILKSKNHHEASTTTSTKASTTTSAKASTTTSTKTSTPIIKKSIPFKPGQLIPLPKGLQIAGEQGSQLVKISPSTTLKLVPLRFPIKLPKTDKPNEKSNIIIVNSTSLQNKSILKKNIVTTTPPTKDRPPESFNFSGLPSTSEGFPVQAFQHIEIKTEKSETDDSSSSLLLTALNSIQEESKETGNTVPKIKLLSVENINKRIGVDSSTKEEQNSSIKGIRMRMKAIGNKFKTKVRTQPNKGNVKSNTDLQVFGKPYTGGSKEEQKAVQENNDLSSEKNKPTETNSNESD